MLLIHKKNKIHSYVVARGKLVVVRVSETRQAQKTNTASFQCVPGKLLPMERLYRRAGDQSAVSSPFWLLPRGPAACQTELPEKSIGISLRSGDPVLT